MAALKIVEYRALGRDQIGHIAQAPLEPPITVQNVAIGGASAQSSALGGATALIALQPDLDCFVAFGADPTADTDSQRLAAGVEVYRAVMPGSALKIAVILEA